MSTPLSPEAISIANYSAIRGYEEDQARQKRGESPKAAIKRLVPHAAQAQILHEAHRFNVIAAGRRIGKTEMAVDRLVETSYVEHMPAAYWAPTYKMLADTWAHLIEVLKPVTSKISVQEKRLDIQGGGSIDCWSFEAPDACRGRKYKRAVIDEAAHSPGLKDGWEKAIRPTLTDLKGDAWFPSTPNGMNDFFMLYQMGLDPMEPDWMSWQMPTSANPFIDADEIESARKMLPEDIFAQEYLASFIADSGAVFRHILAAAQALKQVTGDRRHRYVIGCDWAKYQDFSVFTVIDCVAREVVTMDRMNQIEYALQIDRLKTLCEKFRPVAVISEETGNVALNEMLWRTSIPLHPFTTTNQSKAEIIQALALAFEQKIIKIPNDPVLIGELQAFRFERTDAGNLRYGAPTGWHDDCVMSLALAWSSARRIPRDMVLTYEDKIEERIPAVYSEATVAVLAGKERDVAEEGRRQAYYWAKAEVDRMPKRSAGVFEDARQKYPNSF